MNIAIVEDENEYASVLKSFLARYADAFSEEFEITHFLDAESFLKDYRPVYSIVFMDIELPLMNGMDAAREVRKIDAVTAIIFVTNMAQYACAGYEVDAVDFVVKPIGYADFALKLRKAIKIAKTSAEVDVLVPRASGFARVPSSKLMYVEVFGHRIKYHLTDSVMEAKGSLADAGKSLAGCGFLRCNNSTLVNPRHIISVKGYSLQVGDIELAISQPRKKAFMLALNDYFSLRSSNE